MDLAIANIALSAIIYLTYMEVDLMCLKKNHMLLSLFLLSVSLLTACTYNISSGDGLMILSKESAKTFSIKKTAVEPIKAIDINTRISDVEIVKSDDYYVEIDYLYWKEEPVYTLTDGRLTFNDEKSFPKSYSINFNPKNIIKVFLPEDAPLDDISVNCSSGNVSISAFIADSLRVKNSYGNCKLADCAASKADIKLSSGDCTISDFQTGDLDIDNSYGNINLKNINTGGNKPAPDISFDKTDIEIDMSSGNANINNVYAKSLKINNSYGNIDCDTITADSFKARLSSGNLNIKDGDIKESDFKNSYGDIELKLTGNENDYSLDLDNSYGDIVVNGRKYEDNLKVIKKTERSIYADLSSGNIKIKFNE